MEKSTMYWISSILMIVGALNWGFATFDFNLVETIFGVGTFAKVIYGLVGLAGIWGIYELFK